MSSFFKTMQKEKNSPTLTNSGAISEKYVGTEVPNSYYGKIQTTGTSVDGMYECEAVDVLNFENVCLSFPTDKGEFKLFDNFNLDIKDFKHHGQFISFMGASGSGKSQILKLIAGLNKPNSGKVKLYGKERKDNDSIPMVFQQYSSYPWMTVLENVALPLRLHGIKESDKLQGETDEIAVKRIAMNMIKIVGLDGHENKYAQYPTLSGGQLQRVSLARNLVYSSKILLLDEATDKWGCKVNRVEIKDINPPKDIRDAMEKQMNAERNKRALILEAEGERQSAITLAEGRKQAAILDAEADREAKIRRATGEAEAIRQVADAKAKEIQMVYEAIKNANPDDKLVQIKALEALKEAASGPANKIFIPFEATKALGSLGAVSDIVKEEKATKKQ